MGTDGEHKYFHYECMFCGTITKSNSGTFDREKLFELDSYKCPTVCISCKGGEVIENQAKAAGPEHIVNMPKKLWDDAQAQLHSLKELLGEVEKVLSRGLTGERGPQIYDESQALLARIQEAKVTIKEVD